MPDKELLLERLERLAIVLDELMPQCAELVRDAIAMLKQQDVEPVHSLVHCKDCKHRPVKLSDGITLAFPDDECPYKAEDNDYSFYPDDLWFCANGEAVVNIPVNQVKSTTDYDTLIVGSCPVCGQARLNNRDNRMCGMCGAKLTWLEPYKLSEVDNDVGEE